MTTPEQRERFGRLATDVNIRTNVILVDRKHDWCHLCGARKEAIFWEATYPHNAEAGSGGDRCTRFCDECIEIAWILVQDAKDHD